MVRSFLFLAVVASLAADDPAVFRTVVRKQGDDNVHTYRIPGLACSTKGTLLAVFDLRHKHSGDLMPYSLPVKLIG